MLAGALLPWPFGHPSFRLGGLAKYLLINRNPDGKVFLDSIDTLHKTAEEIINEKLRDPKLSEKRDLLAMFMNSEVTIEKFVTARVPSFFFKKKLISFANFLWINFSIAREIFMAKFFTGQGWQHLRSTTVPLIPSRCFAQLCHRWQRHNSMSANLDVLHLGH
jgi:hypothetical protein